MCSIKQRYMALVPFVVLIISLLALGRWSPTSVRAGDTAIGTTAVSLTDTIGTQLYLPFVAIANYPSPTPTPTHTPTPTAGPTIFGSQINAGFVSPVITRAVEANLSWIRYDKLLWSDVEEERGNRDWTKLSLFEDEISLLSQNGRTPIVVVRSTPSWAQKNPPYYCSPIREDALDDFADFMRELVTRYSGPPYNVTYWEIWNEPDVDSLILLPETLFGCWGDESDPYYGGGYYAEMLKKVYPAMKEANPDVQIMLGGLLLACDPTNPGARDCQPANFLEGILRNGGGDYFDLVAYHAYAFWWPSGSGDWDLADSAWNPRGGLVLGKADFLREVLAQYDAEKPLMLTEGSLVCHESVCPDLCHETDPDCPPPSFFQAQANYVIRLYARTWANDFVAVTWYQLFYNGYWRYSSLLNESHNPRPAYTAIQFMSELLSGATYAGELGNETLEGYQFENAQTGLTYQIYWTNDMAITDTLSLPANTRAIYDKLGQQITPSETSILVGFEPIIIEVGLP